LNQPNGREVAVEAVDAGFLIKELGQPSFVSPSSSWGIGLTYVIGGTWLKAVVAVQPPSSSGPVQFVVRQTDRVSYLVCTPEQDRPPPNAGRWLGFDVVLMRLTGDDFIPAQRLEP
jgi:hypothetical protein